jgi:hypothetical protein
VPAVPFAVTDWIWISSEFSVMVAEGAASVRSMVSVPAKVAAGMFGVIASP